ncbi:MAG: hypothetical protein DRJ03_14110 [Chloroflexi bacterium]|nr:MAG: hypothetical protein DRJ03_14110 [Chloroflexota bacterium]
MFGEFWPKHPWAKTDLVITHKYADIYPERPFFTTEAQRILSLFSAPLDSLIWGLTLCSSKPNLGRFAAWVSEKPGFSEKTWFLSPLFEKDTNRLRQDAKYRLR